jgi:lipid II:glycine glycyltransferase (peptidoglycan interpeptide bridge formation enzyme)
VREVRNATQTEWDGWLESSPGGGHIFQSYEWGEFKRTRGWRPVRLVLQRGDKVVGLGQFLAYNTAPVPGTLWYCTKGPWLPWDDEQAVRTFFEGVRSVAACEGAHTVKIEPEVVEQQTRVKDLIWEIGFRKFRWDLNAKTDMVVELSLPEEDLLANMRRTTRYNIRLAARKGVRIVEDNSFEAREHFLHMVKITGERNGFAMRRPDDYFLALWRTLREAGSMYLFFAEHEGDRLAAMLLYASGRKYWPWNASTNEKRNLKPTELLQWEVMRWAKRRGLTCCNMGGIPNPKNLDNESDPWYSLYRFKSGFGGEIMDTIGCLDLAVNPVRAKLWNRIEPMYYRLYMRLKRDIYY